MQVKGRQLVAITIVTHSTTVNQRRGQSSRCAPISMRPIPMLHVLITPCPSAPREQKTPPAACVASTVIKTKKRFGLVPRSSHLGWSTDHSAILGVLQNGGRWLVLGHVERAALALCERRWRCRAFLLQIPLESRADSGRCWGARTRCRARSGAHPACCA